jgi:hypothetical protein
MALQLACMTTSGMVFFAPVAGSAALWYSLTYNATCALPELALALWLTAPLLRSLARANVADAWRRGLLEAPRPAPRSARRYAPPRPAPAVPEPGPPPAAAVTTPARQAFVRPAPFSARRLAR